MRQLLIRRGSPIVLDVPPPLVEPGHVLVAVAYSLISAGTELSSLQGSGRSLIRRALDRPEQALKVLDHLRQQGVRRTVGMVQGKLSSATPIGYSCSGTVVQVGAGVTDLQVGDRVACAGAGKANHAEWVIVPRNLVAPVPSTVSLRDAASTTLGAIALQGVRRADLRLGEWAAVIGLGLLGQLTAQLLRAAGIQVLGFDVDPRRVEKARAAGAALAFSTTDVDPRQEVGQLTEGHGVDAAIITAASQSDAVAQQAIELTRARGRVVVVGAVGLGLQRSPFYEKELDFLIARSYGPGRYDSRYEEQGLDYPYAYVRWTENRNMAEYLRLLAERQVDFAALAEAEYSLDEADQAYAALQRAEDRPIAVMLRYPDAPPDTPPSSTRRIDLRAPAPRNGRLRVALVGSGSFAQGMHLPNLQRLADSYEIRAIVSRTGSSARLIGEQFGAAYVTAEYNEALADPEIDMVLITTRHHLHAEQAIRAARAGKAIFVEKPMAIAKDELERLAEALHETGVPYMVGFNRRFSPAARRARELLAGRKNPLMIIYRVNAGYLPLDHWVHSEQGGGRIVGEACHMFDLFQYLVGPARVVDVGATAIVPKVEHLSAADNVAATVRYSDGSVATLFYSAMGAPELGKEYVEIYAGGKVLVIDDYQRLSVHGASAKGWEASTQDKGHLEELRAFAAYARGVCDAPILLDELIDTTRVSLAVAGGGT
jgi:predicted dehydrogenase/threonine dehydrogenase-like Zn-dependent dehydrogenase